MNTVFSVLYVGRFYLRLVLFDVLNGQTRFLCEKKMPYAGFKGLFFINSEETFNTIINMFTETERNNDRSFEVCKTVLPTAFYKFDVVTGELVPKNGVVTGKATNICEKKCRSNIPNYVPLIGKTVRYYTSDGNIVENPTGMALDKLYFTVAVEYLNEKIKEFFENCGRRSGKKFEFYSEQGLLADAARHKTDCLKKYIFVDIGDGATEVCDTDGIAIRNAAEISFGEEHIAMVVDDITGDKRETELVLNELNLNLLCGGEDYYRTYNAKYGIKRINYGVISILKYISDAVKRSAVRENIDEADKIFITGSDICLKKGVRELFEDELGRPAEILRTDFLSLEGCKSVAIAAAASAASDKKGFFNRLIKGFSKRRQ